MKTQANQVRAGNVIELNNKIYLITKHEIVIPGKGNAVIHFEMKDVVTGTKNVDRFRTNVSLEVLRLDHETCTFLYKEGDRYMVMNAETFDQMEIPEDILGDKAAFLQEGMEIKVQTYESKILNVEIPNQVTLEISETEPVIKGQTVTSSYKPAMCNNGIRVMVPPFIDAGTRIVVKTEDSTYVERAKD